LLAGFFELSSNRRDIWHGKGMAGTGQLRCDWNVCLLQDVAASSYAKLLAIAATKLGPVPAFYKLWPVQHLMEPWSVLAAAVLKEVASYAVVHTAAGGGRWITPGEAVYVDAVAQRYYALLSLFTA
jgi:sacsin